MKKRTKLFLMTLLIGNIFIPVSYSRTIHIVNDFRDEANYSVQCFGGVRPFKEEGISSIRKETVVTIPQDIICPTLNVYLDDGSNSCFVNLGTNFSTALFRSRRKSSGCQAFKSTR